MRFALVVLDEKNRDETYRILLSMQSFDFVVPKQILLTCVLGLGSIGFSSKYDAPNESFKGNMKKPRQT
jgi:hypothetical protein